MTNKKQPNITDGKYTVNSPGAVSDIQRQLSEAIEEEKRKLRAEYIRKKYSDFKLNGDMAQQFNEHQERYEEEEFDDDGL